MKSKLESITMLKDTIKQNDIIYTDVKKVSSSGMYRHIKTYIIRDNKPLDISCHVANAIGWAFKDKTFAVGVGGCGMDMGFHLVSTLANILFDDYKQLKQEWL